MTDNVVDLAAYRAKRASRKRVEMFAGGSGSYIDFGKISPGSTSSWFSPTNPPPLTKKTLEAHIRRILKGPK
jgi:hypothetical protein